jgi:hypothetical protein
MGAVQMVGYGESLNMTKALQWRIVTDEAAIPSDRYAAEEFQSLVKQIYGASLPIESAAKPEGNIFIGHGKAMESSSVGFGISDLGEEGLRIKISAQNISIAGGQPRGTLYGVYEFMERYLGVRFLTRDHTYIPAPPASSIPCEEFACQPQFSFRWSYYRENADAPDFAAKLRVNTVTNDEKYGGICSQSLINHSLMRYLPAEQYGKDHPEYFALVDGERKLEMGGGGPEVCSTNPSVIDLVAQNVIKDLDASPNHKNISVSQNDNDAYCHCPVCEEVNQREGTPMGSHLAFVNAVAERVEAKHPDVMVGTLAYWYTRKPPKTIVPRKNIQIQLCSIECCTLHPINDPNCEKNREFCQDLADWKRVCNNIWVWNYNTNFRTYDLPFPNLRAIGPNVRFFAENNVKGVFMQANGNGTSGEMSDLRNYVISRCLWNPQLDGWSMVQEFCRLHYGKAAQPILDYLVMIHDNAESLNRHPACFPSAEDVGLNADIALKSLKYFDQALAAAENDEVRGWVEKASIPACKAVLEAGGPMEFKDGFYRMRLPAEAEGVYSRYIDLCQRYKMSMVTEHSSPEGYFEQVRHAEKGFKAERIENDVWRVTLLPEDHGQIVDLHHKPSGRNLVAATNPGNLGISFNGGSIQEIGIEGFDEEVTSELAAGRTDSEITLLKTLPDGTSISRMVSLDPLHPERVRCEGVIERHGNTAEKYQVKIRPEFDIVTESTDTAVFAAYIKGDSWVQFNEGWEKRSGPHIDLLKSSKGGQYAFFNHKDKFGVLLDYHPEQIEHPGLTWTPAHGEANLELFTSEVELKSGEKFAYDYSFEYLTQPPVD